MTKEDIDRLIEEEGDHERFEYRGLRCYIVRNPVLGFLMGYVEQLYFVDCDDAFEKLDVHGGVTFIGRIGETHYPVEQREKNVRVIGFDCGHIYDYIPKIEDRDAVYRDMRYVENECKRLADQLLAIAEEREKDA